MSKDTERKRITDAIGEGKKFEDCGFDVCDNATEGKSKKKANV